ncbi:HAD-IA family hydrolase [Jannaschia sp. M317]|uniref:HAD-IA family hydrolase n=1 Tax=Jannaschia sp. M317 TaxID=2867011 RepID=UPI0021A3E2D1|nr:HAD-IA family hydrolase [Jannaschia sp. M317]UWQ17296.1 HAD-IA family hydrolase [Jannaschia sp. M317]
MTDFLALFDVDGTLVDSAGVIVDTMSRAFARSDLPAPPADAVRPLIGLSLPGMIARLADGVPTKVVDRIVADYRLGFAAAMESGTPTQLYPGAEAALAGLAERGVTLGVATGKSQRGLNRLIKAERWDGLFKTLQCADHHPSKPHPSMIRRALLECALEEDRAVMIGDSVYDMEMARAAGVAAIGVSWGYTSGADLLAAGATRIVDDFSTLTEDIVTRAR